MTAQFPHAIDNSMRKELVKCETAAHYKYELGLRSVESAKVDLVAGGAFAAGMEVMRRAYYQDLADPYKALQEGIKAVYAKYGSFIPPAKSNKTADRMAGALAFYNEQCPLTEERLIPIQFPDGSWAIEVGFDFDIPIRHPETGTMLKYAGRFDMLARDPDGNVWVVDEKTTSQMGDKWANQWLLDSQMTGYCWGGNQLLAKYGMNEQVQGAIINGVAIRLRDYEHVRLTTYRQEWEIDRWHSQMLRDVRRWEIAYARGEHNLILDHACATYNNPCEFSPLCKSRNPERLIEGGSYEVVRWNPITREEA